MFLEFYNLFIGTLALVLHVVAVLGILGLIFLNKKSEIVNFIGKKYQWIVLVFGWAAIFGSLTYSEYIGFTPCKLCWIQRIFLYPTAIMALIALISKEKIKPKYYLGLAVPGLLVSIYHTFSQLTGAEMECGEIGQSASCGDVWVKMYGYITIPAMAATCGIMIILANLYRIKQMKK
jgi:disulfide bond formation protein DsbB